MQYLPLVNIFVPTTDFNGMILSAVHSSYDYSGYKVLSVSQYL